MSNHAQIRRIAAITAMFTLCVAPWCSLGAAAPSPPVFVEESVDEFLAGARTEPHTESVQHLDPAKYRAFKFLNSARILIGAAAGISVTADGKVDIVQAPGTVLTVRANVTHRVLSHLALLRDGKIEPSLLRKP